VRKLHASFFTIIMVQIIHLIVNADLCNKVIKDNLKIFKLYMISLNILIMKIGLGFEFKVQRGAGNYL
jgi:hypothetical protein